MIRYDNNDAVVRMRLCARGAAPLRYVSVAMAIILGVTSLASSLNSEKLAAEKK